MVVRRTCDELIDGHVVAPIRVRAATRVGLGEGGTIRGRVPVWDGTRVSPRYRIVRVLLGLVPLGGRFGKVVPVDVSLFIDRDVARGQLGRAWWSVYSPS